MGDWELGVGTTSALTGKVTKTDTTELSHIHVVNICCFTRIPYTLNGSFNHYTVENMTTFKVDQAAVGVKRQAVKLRPMHL